MGERRVRSPFLLQLREKFEIFRKLWYNKMGVYRCLMQLPAAIKFDKLQLLQVAAAWKFDSLENLRGEFAHTKGRTNVRPRFQKIHNSFTNFRQKIARKLQKKLDK
jgi:hypothetical protein